MAVFIFGPVPGSFFVLGSGFLRRSPSRVVELFSKSVQSAPACLMAGRRRISPTPLDLVVGLWTGFVRTCLYMVSALSLVAFSWLRVASTHFFDFSQSIGPVFR